jgi:serine/threonine protein kinase
MKRGRFEEETIVIPDEGRTGPIEPDDGDLTWLLDLKMNEVLGSGSYAVVYASITQPNVVYRVEAVLDEALVKREVEIQRFLFNSELSPCIPEIYFSKEILKFDLKRQARDLYENLAVIIFNKVDITTIDSFLIVKMERGNLGTIDEFAKMYTSKMQIEFPKLCFLLFWTLYVFNTSFGFRHRDIKPKNIVVKKLDAPKTFQFRLGDNKWSFETRYVPMLIDFGLASLVGSRPSQRTAAGTIYYVPPEVLANMMWTEHRAFSVPTHNFENEDAFDTWSLSLALLEVGTNYPIMHTLVTLFARRGAKLVDSIFKDPKITRDTQLTYRYMIFLAIATLENALENDPVPSANMFDSDSGVYSRLVLTPDAMTTIREFVRESDVTDQVKKLVRKLNNLEKPERSSWENIFSSLLSWEAEGRVILNRRRFMQYYKMADTLDESLPIYSAKRRQPFSMQDNTSKNEALRRVVQNVPFIYSNIECSMCENAQAETICSDCDQSLCSECQRR